MPWNMENPPIFPIDENYKGDVRENLLNDFGRYRSTLEETWWVFSSEAGMDDILEKGKECLRDEMFDIFKIEPVQVKDGEKLFLARFEFPLYEEKFEHEEALEDYQGGEKPVGFIDFLGGFPLDCIELLAIVGERSSKKEDVISKKGELSTAPMPDELFGGYQPEAVPVNYTAIEADFAIYLAKGLAGEPKTENPRWWLRMVLKKEAKFPAPGEFLALAVRMMPDKPWGRQKTSPFFFAGNWMDTVHYSSAKVTEVQEPTDGKEPWKKYRVKWRDQVILANPLDFAEYQVDDKVCILKQNPVAGGEKKKFQLWKDDDMEEFNQDNWGLAPITFYGLDDEAA